MQPLNRQNVPEAPMRKYDRKSKLLDDAKQHFRRGHKVLVKVRDVSKICTSLGQVRKFMRKHPGTHQVERNHENA